MSGDDPIKALVRKYDRAVVEGGGESLFTLKSRRMVAADLGSSEPPAPKPRKLGWLKHYAAPTEPPDYVAIGDEAVRQC